MEYENTFILDAEDILTGAKVSDEQWDDKMEELLTITSFIPSHYEVKAYADSDWELGDIQELTAINGDEWEDIPSDCAPWINDGVLAACEHAFASGVYESEEMDYSPDCSKELM